MYGNTRRTLFDDGSTVHSTDSSISSYSGSGSTWSLPRSRGARRIDPEGGPRRTGNSFRVSLRPSRYRHQHSRERSATGEENDDRAANKQLAKKMLLVVCSLGLVVWYMSVLRPRSTKFEYLYEVYDKLSTEDLVAQGEMSANTDEEVLERAMSQGGASELVATTEDASDSEVGSNNTNANEIWGLLALRGSSLAILQDEDDMALPPKMEEEPIFIDNMTNTTQQPKRADWSPVVLNRTDINFTTVAYILPVYSCYKLSGQPLNQYGLSEPANDREFQDAVVMLQASVHKNSRRTPSSGSTYDYQMVALVHRGVERCAGGANRTAMLERLGYRVEIVREPIHQDNIVNSHLQKHAPRNNGGRAGMREMIRLYAFKMVEYRITVLVEPTSFLLHPADAMWDVLLHGPRGHAWAEAHPEHIIMDTFYPNGTIITEDHLPAELDILFTRDYSSMTQSSWTTGISLAFVAIRPSLALYQKLINIYQGTNYDPQHGWDSKGYAHYAGSMQTKGLLTYYFSELAPHRKLELQRCIYNNLADVPFIAGRKGSTDNCRDVKEHRTLPDGSVMPCTDCRIQNFDAVIMANFAICQSPWVCPYIDDSLSEQVPLLGPTLKMCRRFHTSWFALRKTVEATVFSEPKRSKTTGTFHPEIFQGYCQPGGARGGAYVSMDAMLELPDGMGQAAFQPEV